MANWQGGLLKLQDFRNTCEEFFRSNSRIKEAYIYMERVIIHNIMIFNHFGTGRSQLYNLKDVSLSVVNINEVNGTSPATGDRLQLDGPQLLLQSRSSIPKTWLPVDALLNITEEERVVGLVSYMWPDQFRFGHEEFSSMVFRIELLKEERFINLTTSLRMIFNVTTDANMPNNSSQCHFFDEDDYGWKTDGCKTNRHIYQNYTEFECNCDHNTPFSILMIRQPISEYHWNILSYVSYIGCGLSAFFTTLSIMIFIFSRNCHVHDSTFIHASLSGALFLLNSLFMLSQWGATLNLEWVCVLIAAVIHYSLLCCFTWMALEALHLYFLLIKVFNTNYKRYLFKLSLLGWGIPGVTVGVSLGVSLGVKDNRQLYGTVEMNMTDTNQSNKICWIIDDSFCYGVNLV
ncbi:adhesion G-protein coupled receptor G6, partial [Lampris incognitus]|uniref:adhesion G-protein coupled receptor G6 n=1 Tax=Lampris incognitus TaxID=2546036 RepID=UPI0024B58F2D